MYAALTTGIFAVTTLALGLLLAFMPYFMRQNECFAVTVPTSAHNNPHIVACKRCYARAMTVVTIICVVITIAAGCLIAMDGTDEMISIVGVSLECAAIFGLSFVSFILMLRGRRSVLAIKQAEGWVAQGSKRAAVVGEEDIPKPIALAWNLLYVVVVLFTLALGIALYPVVPELIPMQVTLSGAVSRWAEKSVALVFGFPLLIETIIGLSCFGCHAVIIHSKRPTNANVPATSALAYGMFARAKSVYLLISGIGSVSCIGLGFLLSAANILTLEQLGAAVLIMVALIGVSTVALVRVYGQSGSRLFGCIQSSDIMPDDDDEHWKLGIFYCNHDDASVFLPKRFGIGWTINFAHVSVWIGIGCFLTVSVFVVTLLMLF